MSQKKTHLQGTQTLPYHLLSPKHWLTWLAIFIIYLITRLPNRLRDAIAMAVGGLIYRRNKKRTTIVRTNLALCYPKLGTDELEALTQKHFRAYYCGLFTMSRLWWGSPKSIEKKIKAHGFEHVENALHNKRAVILMTCHTSTLEYAGTLVNFKYPSLAYYHRFKNPVLEWWMLRCRTRFGSQVLSRGSNLTDTIRLVRKGVVMNYVGDEDLGRDNAIFSPFYGNPKATQIGLAKLAKLCRADVIPCFNYYDNKTGKNIITYFPALQNFPSGDNQIDANLLNQTLQEMIEICPEQYMWTMKIFKTQQQPGQSKYR